MTPTKQPWEQRLDWLLSVLLWTAFGLGMFLSVVPDGTSQNAIIASVAAAAYVVTMQVVPRPIRHSDNVGELLAVSGVVVALVAVALTDGIDSPFCSSWPHPHSLQAPFSAIELESRLRF